MSQLIIEVKRNRPSVTQGSATIYINGEKAIAFGDDMYLRHEDGTFSNGHRTVENAKHYGAVIGGWGSIRPDSSFVLGLLYHPYDNIYHNSDMVKQAIFEMDSQAVEEDDHGMEEYCKMHDC